MQITFIPTYCTGIYHHKNVTFLQPISADTRIRGEIQLLTIFPTLVEFARSLPFSQQSSAETLLKSRIFAKCMLIVSVGHAVLWWSRLEDALWRNRHMFVQYSNFPTLPVNWGGLAQASHYGSAVCRVTCIAAVLV